VQGYLIGKPCPIAQYRHVTGAAVPEPRIARAG